MHALWQVIIIVAVCLVIWMVAERFSPDPLITKIVQIIVFIVAIGAVLFKLLPMVWLNLTYEAILPSIEFYLEKGMSPKEARERVRQDVFGVGYKTDRHGNPIEQGFGSAARPTDQHFRALEKAEGKEAADKARAAVSRPVVIN